MTEDKYEKFKGWLQINDMNFVDEGNWVIPVSKAIDEFEKDIEFGRKISVKQVLYEILEKAELDITYRGKIKYHSPKLIVDELYDALKEGEYLK